MATGTHTLIERITVGAAGAASVTFNSIPQTGYTDLKIVGSARLSTNGGNTWYDLTGTFNGSATGYSGKQLYGTGSAAGSQTEATTYFAVIQTSSTATASTFGSFELYVPNYTSSNYKSVSQDRVTENNAASALISMIATLWSNTAAITSLSLAAISGTIVQFSTFSLYGIAAIGTTPTKAPKAVGGDIIQTDGTYWYHAFINTGAFVPATGLTCDVLVVAGGGAGGGSGNSGGGGAGGTLAFASQSFASGVSQTVTIGSGGVGSFASLPTSGVNSQFGSLTAAVGGGYGAPISPSQVSAATGGSGGGGSYANLTGASGTSGQGNTGGNGLTNSSTYFLGGGGGGAGAVGVNATSTTAGAGGAGVNTVTNWGALSSALTATGLGASGYISGGGGAGGDYFRSFSPGTGGSGGGGTGGNNSAGNAGTANTGSGGGGGDNRPGSGTAGGNGASGLVIVRYAV